MNRPFGTHPTQSTVFIKQGYINVDDFLLSKFGVRIGVQDVTFRNRPQDEPFFMDLGESEGFYRGFRPAEALITNTVDRDITEPVGVRLFYSPFEIMTLQAFWMVVGEGGGTPHDESVYGLVANSLLGEDWSAWLMFVAVSGGEGGLGTIETFGLGLDGFFFDDKAVEVFVEGYAQTGTLRHAPAAIHKSAYAYSLGARYLGFFNRKLWLEVAYSRRSGDRRIGDDHDSAFQSYENVNRFLILESSEFGLDVDTNISSTRLTVGVGPFDVSGRPFRVQLDVGRFAAATQVVGPIGVIEGRMWGIESDLSFIYDYNSSLSFKLKGALLGDSSLLKQLVNENHAWMIVFGADLNF
jgi:hypothetical protein